jgi:hypothetical protein
MAALRTQFDLLGRRFIFSVFVLTTVNFFIIFLALLPVSLTQRYAPDSPVADGIDQDANHTVDWG